MVGRRVVCKREKRYCCEKWYVLRNRGAVNIDKIFNVLMGNSEGKTPQERHRHSGNYTVNLLKHSGNCTYRQV
jgi:hypothetical protein